MLSLFQANWRLKLLLTVALNAFFWAGYATLGRHAFFPLHAVPLTALDHAVPFQPQIWGWVYFSLYSFTLLLPWLLTERRAIHRYAAGLLVMMAASFVVFLFLPTASPRVAVVDVSLPMRIICAYDGPLNAFPSLHAGFIVYMGLLAWRMFGQMAPRWTAGVTWIWGAAIFYSTLATKQHYALDLLAGAVVGAASDWFAWRGAPDAEAAMMMPRMSGSASHAGAR